MNRTIEFFLIMMRKTMTRRGIIPRESIKKSAKTWLPGVWYPSESISPGYLSYPGETLDQIFHKISPGSHTLWSQSPQGIIPQRSQSPRGIILRRVNLPGVCDPGGSLMTRGVNSHFFTLLQRPLKGQWHKNKCWFLFYYQRAPFCVFAKMF